MGIFQELLFIGGHANVASIATQSHVQANYQSMDARHQLLAGQLLVTHT